MSSTSKMSVLNGLICPMSRSPYAISCGMKSCHLLPTGIMVSASVQPFITWSARKVAGLPPCFSVESNTVPSMSRPSYFTFTRLDFCGTSPLPFTSTLYCSPLGSTTTPSFFAFSARKVSPAVRLAPYSLSAFAFLL